MNKRKETVTTSQISQGWVAGAALMIVAGALFKSQPLFGLGLLLGVSVGVAWLWARVCLRYVAVERRFSQHRAFFGEQIDMTQIFTNGKPLPIPWMSVDDEVPGTLEVDSAEVLPSARTRTVELRTAVSIGWYERLTRHYSIKCTARGEHEFGPMEISSGDVFGLFRRSETITTPETLLVYPRYVPVEKLGITARQPFGDFKAIQHLATDPLRLRGIREYAYGDNPRHVHWKATARRGSLQTKIFEPVATPQLFIFCNQDTFSRVWEGIDLETLELTITVAASLANYGIEHGYMVGLQVNAFSPSSDTQVKIAPSRDPGQFTRILENLARIKGWSGLPMEELISAERRNLPRAATIVLVTGVVTEDMLGVLTALRRAGHPVTLVETAGARRAKNSETERAPAEALRTQGIIYYLVEDVDPEAGIEGLSF